ncbi:MAG: hypothetical protein Q4A88_05000 [Clostridia bacterium]|nr:hypothetical protein [Clostridia bacterium]
MKRVIFGLTTALLLCGIACGSKPSPVSELTRIEQESKQIVLDLHEAMQENTVPTEEDAEGMFGNYVRVSVTFREEGDQPSDSESTERQNRTAASELCPTEAIESVSDSKPQAVVRVPLDTLESLTAHPRVESVQLLESEKP